MTTIDNTTASTFEKLGLASQESDKKSGELGQDQFLELMLAQMKNQDPLDPMDNQQFVSQLAQFSTARGVSDMNKSMSDLSSSLQSNQALQASSLVGRTVSVPSEYGELPADGKLEGEAVLPSSTTDLAIGIYDNAGQLVRRIDMGSQASGDIAFSWDGKADDGTQLAPGTYQIKAEAIIDGKASALDTNVYADVQSVNMGGGKGVELNLAGVGKTDFANVKQIK
jgi:flagellar basal-body rod modification protein FlgD